MAESPSSSSPSAAEGESGDGGESVGHLSDRVLGGVCLIGAIWYTATARTYEGTGFGSGPVGPKTLPTGIGILFGALALYIMFRPDPSPTWPGRKTAGPIILVVAASYAYGQIIEPVGFILSSAAMIIVIGLLFRAPLAKLLPLSVAFPVVLAFVFNNWLGLQLPDGLWGGF